MNRTRTYFVTCDVTANVTFEVEAHDSEEAKEIANQLNFTLLIVGEPGIGQQDYLRLWKEKAHDNVYFWGKETNPQIMRILYENAFLTAIPSVTEMLPLVIFESLSQKTPVLCTTHCGG